MIGNGNEGFVGGKRCSTRMTLSVPTGVTEIMVILPRIRLPVRHWSQVMVFPPEAIPVVSAGNAGVGNHSSAGGRAPTASR